MTKAIRPLLLSVGVAMACAAPGRAQDTVARIPIRVERAVDGAPLTFGIPFPKDALRSPEEVRVVTVEGREIPSQITEVSTWEPADTSIKWVWVFFFAEEADRYVVEYGSGVQRAPTTGARILVRNNQRDNGGAEVTTGPLRFTVRKGEGGFLGGVALDVDDDGFDAADVIADGAGGRGSFLDLLDDAGVGASRAFVTRTVVEKGSGPLHAIVRVEGEYRYNRSDNNAAPFVTRIHAYAGRSYLRVQHTFVYTGVPDKHRPQDGDQPHVATQNERLIVVDRTDTGWTVPEDRIAAAGLSVGLKLSGDRQLSTRLREGAWWETEGRRRTETHGVESAGDVSLFQTGEAPTRMPPLPSSSNETRMGGFAAQLRAGERTLADAERADGWVDLSDERRGLAIGIRHFLEEYPKEIRFDAASTNLATAFLWSPRADPMSFARFSNEPGQENAVENWAQGHAKTSEAIFYFHPGAALQADLARTMSYVLEPPVPHADPGWYGRSGVYGRFAGSTGRFPDFERALDYKFDWVLFNQQWEPWFGMFDYGDLRNSFDGAEWRTWGHGEPAQDYMIWLQFMRTGDADIFDAAQAASRHLMDVDNTHWPRGPVFHGDTNHPLDYWRTATEPAGSKYLGIGRRHSDQHWIHVLSAHVWVQGWLADYYLAADHRGLDVAIQTADLHLRRIWGEHGLTGRRLYLSVWNLVEVWDATKDERYRRELDDRVRRMLHLQEREQGGSLVMDRYGYTHVYAAHGLKRYLDMTGDQAVRTALIRSARRARDVPPIDHTMESLLSSVISLLFGYELSGEQSLLDEMTARIEVLRTAALPRPIDRSWTQRELFEALEQVNRLPEAPDRPRAGWSFTNGLRIFGWTHAYTLPYVLDTLTRIPAEPAPADANGRRPGA